MISRRGLGQLVESYERAAQYISDAQAVCDEASTMVGAASNEAAWTATFVARNLDDADVQVRALLAELSYVTPES